MAAVIICSNGEGGNVPRASSLTLDVNILCSSQRNAAIYLILKQAPRTPTKQITLQSSLQGAVRDWHSNQIIPVTFRRSNSAPRPSLHMSLFFKTFFSSFFSSTTKIFVLSPQDQKAVTIFGGSLFIPLG